MSRDGAQDLVALKIAAADLAKARDEVAAAYAIDSTRDRCEALKVAAGKIALAGRMLAEVAARHDPALCAQSELDHDELT
jgi:hypothetical protein